MMSSTIVHLVYDPVSLVKRPNPSSVISLYDEIDEKLCSIFFGDTLECSITVRPDTQVTFLDDLERLPFSSFNITITLQQNSELSLRNSLIDTAMATLAGTVLTSTVHLSEAAHTKNVRLVFAGKGAKATVVCTYLVDKKRKYKLTTVQDHQSPDTQSSLIVKGVFDGEAQFFCDNLIKIHKDAQHVDAFQVNKNLLLSETARAVSIPKMQVDANDVSCKHGAATSKMSQEHLFYVQSRGMDMQQAKELLIQAFLQ